jgi:predicted kinase
MSISLDMDSPYCRNDNGMIALHHRRKTAMQMLRRGEITVSEAATIALVSRQRVREWCKVAGISPQVTRAAWLTQILLKMNRLDGKH